MIGTILFAALMMIAVGAVICLWGWQLPIARPQKRRLF
jgi:hypothetical protein